MSKKLLDRWTSAAEGTGIEIVRVHVIHDEPDLDGCECVHYVCGDVSGSFLCEPKGSRNARSEVVVFLDEQYKAHLSDHEAVTE